MSGHTKESWNQEISPYLARLAEALATFGRSKDTISLPFSGTELKMTSREQKLVLASQQTGGVVLTPRLELVLDGIGLQAKILHDLQQLEQAETLGMVTSAIEALKDDGVIGARIV